MKCGCKTQQASRQSFSLGVIIFVILVFVVTNAQSSVLSDNFESYSTGPLEYGSVWGAPVTTLGQGASPVISTDISNSGTNSLKFEFAAASQGHSSQWFSLPNMTDVWLQWYQYFPNGEEGFGSVEWQHQNGDGLTHMSFLHLWSGTLLDEEEIGSGVSFYHTNSSNCPTEESPNDNSEIKPMFSAAQILHPGAYDSVGINDCNKGLPWVKFLFHATASDSIIDNGIIQLWVNDDLRVDRNDVPGGNSDNYQSGKFMGKAMSGFAAQTFTYIDDVVISSRPPANIAFVIDKSGSMSSRVDISDPDPEKSKINTAIDAASATFDFLKTYLTYADKIGLVFFNEDDSLPTVTPDGNIFFNATDDNIENLKSEITSITAGGLTSVGNGLNSAKENGFDGYVLPNPYRYNLILLLTDGYQNRHDWVVDNDDDPDNVWNSNAKDFYIGTDRGNESGIFFPTDINICVISLGFGSQQWHEFNDHFNVKRCYDRNGERNSTLQTALDQLESDDPIVLADDFIDGVISSLVLGDKVEKVKKENGSIKSGQKTHTKFIVSKGDIRISMLLMWSHRDITSDSFVLKLKGPIGDVIELDPASKKASLIGASGRRIELDEDIQYDTGNQYIVISFPLPLDKEEMASYDGQWELILNRVKDEKSETSYGVSIYADNQTIASSYPVEATDIGSGDGISLKVKLTEKDKPIKGATVTAHVESPHDSIGNVLSKNDAPPPKPGQTISRDPLSPVQQKVQYLINKPEILEQLLHVTQPDIKLTDPDGDGVYTATYNDTRVPGTYKFTFLVEGATEENGDFTRTQTQTIYVRPKSDPEQSQATIIDIDKDDDRKGRAILKFTPYDKFKNYLGPGYADFIKVVVMLDGKDITDEVRVGGIVDNLDGSYQQEINRSDLSRSARINISLRGEEVVNKSVSQLLPIWWVWWLLLILLLTIIVIFAIKVFKSSP